MSARIVGFVLVVTVQPGIFCQEVPTNQPVAPPSRAPHSYDASEGIASLPWDRWISGRVVLESGGKLPWAPDVTSSYCAVKTAGSSFSVRVLDSNNKDASAVAMDTPRTHRGCPVTVSLPG